MLTEDDLHPESLFGDISPSQAVMALQATAQRSPLPVPANVQQFAREAIADAVQRTRAQTVAATPVNPGCTATETIIEQARAAGIEQLATAYVPTGPTADALPPVAERNAHRRTYIVYHRRPQCRPSPAR